jgi:hypothetical protein
MTSLGVVVGIRKRVALWIITVGGKENKRLPRCDLRPCGIKIGEVNSDESEVEPYCGRVFDEPLDSIISITSSP